MNMIPPCPRLAVLVPCHNEESTIAAVVHSFRRTLASAVIYVYDNNSSDQTGARAREAGAVVRGEPHQGKGNVMRRMFADIEADIYVLVDGDDTYDAASAPALIARLLEDGLDMVVGSRLESAGDEAFRRGTVSATTCSPALSGCCSGAASPICCPGIGCFPGASSNRSRRWPGALKQKPS